MGRNIMGIKKLIKKIIEWAVRPEERAEDQPSMISSSSGVNYATAKIKSSPSSIEDGSFGMNFTVYSATGGKVIQIRSYDPRTDRSLSTLYIITDKEDLGEELAQIITRESFTR